MRKLLFIPFFFLLSCREEVEEIRPVLKPITESIYASGSLESMSQYTAYATANGIVKAIYHQEGDSVLEGSPVLSITNIAQQLNKDNARLVAAFQDINANQGKLRDAKLMIELARTKMVNDSIQLERQKKLDSRGLGTKLELEAAELSYKNAKVSYVSAKTNYDDLYRQLQLNSQQAKNNLKLLTSAANDFTLNSLLTGEVYSLNVSVGEIVSPQTPIAIIGEKNRFLLKMQVDEYDINRLKKGQKVFVVLNSERSKTYDARITRIYPLMNLQNKTFLVEAEFTTRPEKLYPNVTFEANILVRTKDKALLIPREYLIDEKYVLRKSDEKKVKVETGLKDYQMVEITHGIDAKTVLLKPEK